MSRLIDRLKAEKNDPRPSAEITYDVGQQLESSGNKDVFAQNPDFAREYYDIKSSLRRPVLGEMWDALSTGFRDTLPEQAFNAAGALYSAARAGAGGPAGAAFSGDDVTEWLNQQAQREREEAQVHRGEVSVPGVENINDAGDLARFALVGGAEAIPQIAPMVATALLPEGALAAKLAQAGLGARGAAVGATALRSLAPVALQNTGTIYGQLPEDVRSTPEGASTAILGGLASGAVDVAGELAGPLGRFVTKAGGTAEQGIIKSVAEKIGMGGVADYVAGVLGRGGFKGATAHAVKGAAVGVPQMLAHEAIVIAAEEMASGEQLTPEQIHARLKNAAMTGGLVGAELGGAFGLRKSPEAPAPSAAEEAFSNTVAEPRPAMDFGPMEMTPREGEAFNGVVEPRPPLDFGPDKLTPEEYQAIHGVAEPTPPLEFQDQHDIDLESLADQALNASSGLGKIVGLSPSLERDLNVEADSYVTPKKQFSETPQFEGAPQNLPDKYDITKPLLGAGNEHYAADAPSPLNFDQGIFDATRNPDLIRTPEEVARDMGSPENKISPQMLADRKKLIEGAEDYAIQKPSPSDISKTEPSGSVRGVEEEIRQAPEEPAKAQASAEGQEPVIPLAPVIDPSTRIEGGPPLIGRIYSPEDGGNQAKIEAAARGAKANPLQSGTRKAVAILDKSTGQVLVRDVKPGKTRTETGERIQDILIGGMQKSTRGGKGRIIDPVYATESAPWRKVSQEMFQGTPRFEVIGEFAWDDPRASINFNFSSLDSFNAHEQLSQAVRNYFTRGVGAPEDVKTRIESLFPREREQFASRPEIERMRQQNEVNLTRDERELTKAERKRLDAEYWDMLVAHKHKLTAEELAAAKKTLTIKQHAALEAASRAVKVTRKKQITGGGGAVDIGHAQPITEEVSKVIEGHQEESPNPAEAAEIGEIKASQINVPSGLKKLLAMMNKGAEPEKINELATKLVVSKATEAFPNMPPNAAKEFARRSVPAFLEQLKKKGTSIQFSQREATSWLTDPAQAASTLKSFISAMAGAGADVIGLQSDIDSTYDALAKQYSFVLSDPNRGKPVVALVSDWLTQTRPDSQLLLNAAHEAAHLFMDQSGMLTPEQRDAFQSSIHEMGWGNQNYLVGPFATDLRIIANTPLEFLNPEQREILARSTVREIEAARNIPPDELLAERAAEHLALWGVDKANSKGIIQQVIRFIKDSIYQVAMAIQKRLKNGEADPELVKGFVENKWLQFINQDFASSNSSIALSLREWIGAPTTINERMPIYRNLDGDGSNLEWDPQTGRPRVVPTTSDTVPAVLDRINLALERWNAEHGVLPPYVNDLGNKLKSVEDQLEKAGFDFSNPGSTSDKPEIQALLKEFQKANIAWQGLGFSMSDIERILNRSAAAGERPLFSMRAPSESLNPEIEANSQLASINHDDEIYSALHAQPDIVRYLPTGTTYEEFLNKYLQLGPEYNPSSKRESLVQQMKTAVDPLTNAPFNFDEKSTIASLPTGVDGSSPQQAALRDSIIKLRAVKEKVQRRVEQLRDRKDEFDNRTGELSTPERRELDKINSLIPMLERITVLKDVGLDDRIARLESKLGVGFLWDATPGSTYYVPPTGDAGEVAIRGSTASIPANLSFETATKHAFYENVRKQTEWLSNEENKKLGSIYEEVRLQNKKLLAISAEPVYAAQTWRMRTTYFDSLRNMLRGIGTPISKYLGGRFDHLDTILLRWSNDRSVAGQKWSRAYDDFKRSVGWKGADEDFKRAYWNKIVSYMEDVPDGTTDPAGTVIGALEKISKLSLSKDAQSKLRTLIRETVPNNPVEAAIMRENGLKVADEKLGDKAQRDSIRQGFFTGRRHISEQLDRIYQEMKPVWAETGDDKLFTDLAERYAQDPDATRAIASTYFTPTVVNSFVKPFIYHNRQYFKAPAQDGAAVRMAHLSNVREAFEASKGDMVDFARNLNSLEGGSDGTEADMVESTLGAFKAYFQKIRVIANERKKSHSSGVETLPRQIMDARKADDLPPDFVNYATYDQGSNRTLLFQLALNSAFGRNGLSTGEFRKNLDSLTEELRGLHVQLSNLIQVEGKTPEQAREIMGNDKYLIAQQSPDHLRLLLRITDKMAMVTRSSGALLSDIKLLDELVGFNANLILQQPTAALTNTLDVLSPFYRLKMSTQAFSAFKNDVKTLGRDVFGSLFEQFGIHIFSQSESNARMQELGMHDPELYVSWKDKLADYGPSNALDTPAGVESLGQKTRRNALLTARRVKNITNVGIADVGDMFAIRKLGLSPKELTPGDKNIAPKFRLLGIFNTVGHALANGAVDGQYQNFKDLVSRGISFIKNSANPDEVANRMLDGKVKLDPQTLGYTRKWMVFNDQAALDYMRTAIAEKMDEGSLERMVADAYFRTKSDPDARIITDHQFTRIANLAMTEFQLNSNFSNAPIDLKAGGGLWRILSPFLSWPYYAMLRVPDIFKDANNQWKMKAAVDGAAVSMMAIAPLTMAASLVFDWFDENIVGKRRNLREAKLEDVIPGYGPINNPMGTLERLGRYGAGGLLTEAINSSLNFDDARGGMTADNRILFFSQLKNFKDTVGALWQEGPGNANYVSVMRPFAQFLGLGGMLQYQQILNHQLGLSNEEAAVNNRINVANYLRAAGRDLSLNVRISRGPTSIPNEVTPYLQNMELAAYLDDMNMFRDSYRRAVTAYHDLHPDEPDAAKQVVRSFQTRHPLKSVFATLPTERQFTSLMDDLNDTGKEAVSTGIRQFNRYLILLGSKPVDVKDDALSSVQQLRKQVMSNEAVRMAHAQAAQAAYYGSF